MEANLSFLFTPMFLEYVQCDARVTNVIGMSMERMNVLFSVFHNSLLAFSADTLLY